MVLKKGLYKFKDLNSTKIRGTLYKNQLKQFYIQNLKEIKPKNHINKSSYGIKEAFTEEEIPKEEAVVQVEKLITELLLQQTQAQK